MPGKIEGTLVVLDTGCSRTLVRSNMVPQDKILKGELMCAGSTQPITMVQFAYKVMSARRKLPSYMRVKCE